MEFITSSAAGLAATHEQHHQFMFQPRHHNHHDEDDHQLHLQQQQPRHHLLPPCSPQDFHGVSSAQMRRSMSFSGVGTKCDQEMMMNGDDDMSDDGSPLGEKKKRLSMEQVRALEKSFELGNKLEPERKTQLARALGLQPRQVAIWFQNRRARWKTKQLERDYEVLKRKFEALKGENDGLQSQNKKLHDELLALKDRESNGYGHINLNNKETGDQNSWSNGTSTEEANCEVNLATSPPSQALADASLYSHHQQQFISNNKNIFHSSIGTTTTSLTHLLQDSSRSDGLEFRKIDHTVPNESFCNVFNAIEDHAGFWQWTEPQHFNN